MVVNADTSNDLVVAVTGHRPSKLGNEYNEVGPYTEYINNKFTKYLEKNKPTKIITGMALGVDQLWAKAGIRYGIPVIAALPCKGQERIWPKKSQVIYNEILSHPLVTAFYVQETGYTKECMYERNIWMVDNCHELVAVWNGDPSGGTAHTVSYANTIGKSVFRIDPEGWRPIEFLV